MATDMQRLEAKLDKLDERLDSVDLILVRNTGSLEEHMRRRQLAEEAIDILRRELKPVQTHVARVDGGLKLLGILSVVLAVIHQVYSFMH